MAHFAFSAVDHWVLDNILIDVKFAAHLIYNFELFYLMHHKGYWDFFALNFHN